MKGDNVFTDPETSAKRRARRRGPGIQGRKATTIVIDEVVETREESWARHETGKIAQYGDNLGEPVHPFVQQEIAKALVHARFGGKRPRLPWKP